MRTEAERYAVKVGRPVPPSDDHPGHDWTGIAPAREAVILQHLQSSAVYGTWEYGTWNAQPWHAGTDLHELWKPQRNGETGIPLDLRSALACATKLAALHDSGWVHGDIQPAHFIIGPDGAAAIIDLALAQGGLLPHELEFPYPGCLVHYESPEISRSILDSRTAVPTTASDVYGFGASLFISITGWRHVEYPDDAPRTVQRKAIATKPHRPVKIPGIFGKLVDAMLSPVPEDRPTSHEVCSIIACAVDATD
ncbi:protein kinase [Streptomyces sp. CB02923]|uniref:protein kinase n=1 Tax=Streptomyces sp. CB02923 TaxID=1718985 RepID=UPI001F5B3E48|nr:protein kinase [Streptomyces sp. CB02923]